ncbi:MAG: NAD(P)-dependent oxidoreductase [Ilumatobacteraceae bacterium]
MRLFVTGSNGFVGSAVVEAALARGHEVVAMVRPATSIERPSWGSHPSVSFSRGDLRRPGDWADDLDGCDAVVHLAAIPGGDFFTQFAATVLGTEQLLEALGNHPVPRLVHISTFSMYDYRAIPDGSVLDEDSLVEARPLDRDEYLQTKQVQEQMVRDFAAQAGVDLTVVRPGAIYGPGNLWNAGRAACRWVLLARIRALHGPEAHLRRELRRGDRARGRASRGDRNDAQHRRRRPADPPSSKQLSGRRGSKGSAARSPCRSGWCGSSPMWPTP